MHGQLFQNAQELTHLERRLCQVRIRRRGTSLLYTRREQRLHAALHVEKVFSQDTKAIQHSVPIVNDDKLKVPGLCGRYLRKEKEGGGREMCVGKREGKKERRE